MTIGEIIKEYRSKNGISIREMAAKCNVSHGYIETLERGYQLPSRNPVVPSLTVVSKIANGIGTSLEDLLIQIENMPIKIDTQALSFTPLEQNIILRFRSLSDDEKRIILRALDLTEGGHMKDQNT